MICLLIQIPCRVPSCSLTAVPESGILAGQTGCCLTASIKNPGWPNPPGIPEKVPAAHPQENRETGAIPVRFRRCNGGIRAA